MIEIFASYLTGFSFILGLLTGYYFTKWFWFYAGEGIDEIIDFIRLLFIKFTKKQK